MKSIIFTVSPDTQDEWVIHGVYTRDKNPGCHLRSLPTILPKAENIYGKMLNDSKISGKPGEWTPKMSKDKFKAGNNKYSSRSYYMKTLIEWYCWYPHHHTVSIITIVVISLQEGPQWSPPHGIHALCGASILSLCCSAEVITCHFQD